LEKDLEIAMQTGAITGHPAISRIIDFQFVKEARTEYRESDEKEF
jgi:hypothetical protein